MKKVIDGRRYDTATAEEVGYRQYSNPGDLYWWAETLYRKRTGEYFLHGEGGAGSRYGEMTGQNEWSGSEKIMPLKYAAAQKWAEKHLDADVVKKYFGQIQEGDDITTSIRISEGTMELPKRVSAQTEKPISELIEMAVKEKYQ